MWMQIVLSSGSLQFLGHRLGSSWILEPSGDVLDNLVYTRWVSGLGSSAHGECEYHLMLTPVSCIFRSFVIVAVLAYWYFQLWTLESIRTVPTRALRISHPLVFPSSMIILTSTSWPGTTVPRQALAYFVPAAMELSNRTSEFVCNTIS